MERIWVRRPGQNDPAGAVLLDEDAEVVDVDSIADLELRADVLAALEAADVSASGDVPQAVAGWVGNDDVTVVKPSRLSRGWADRYLVPALVRQGIETNIDTASIDDSA